MNLTDLASFVRVAQLGTISAAAEAEGVPKSTISRRVARLEDQLGLALLRRSARSFTLTEDGRLLVRRAEGAVRELEDIEQSVADMQGVPRGRLVVTAPHDLGRQGAMARLLAAYRERCPEVRVEVRLAERMVDLVREGVDVGLRAHAGEIPGEAGLMARALGLPRTGLYASDAYLERRGAPSTPAALAEHDLVGHVASRGVWRLRDAGGVEVALTVEEPAILVNDFGLVRALVVEGAGIGVLPEIVSSGSRSGGLSQVLPGWFAPAAQLSLVWQASRHQAPRVRAFIDLAVELLGADWSPSR